MTGIGESHRIPEEKPSAPIQASSEPTNNVSIENYLHPQPQQVPVQHAPKAQVHHPFIRKQNSVTSSVDGVVQGSLSTSSIHGSTIVPEASTVSIIGATQTAGQNPGNVQDTQATANNAQSNGLGTGNGETKSRGESTSDPSASTSRSSTPSEVVSEDSGEGEKKTGGKSKAAKKDRSKLRKGKWTVEEEEYTSRIIHHFSTGLLTLPEGTTLRSYLAEKLNCDPMRITKKFAGASCLGKRVYHLCDRSQATVSDTEMAKAELARLEHRFRLRVEHGQSGVPFPPRTYVVPSMPSATQMCTAPGPAAVAASWLQSIASTITAQTPGGMQMAPNQMPQPHAPPNASPYSWPFMTTAPQGTHWVTPVPVPPGSKSVQSSMQPPANQNMQTATNEAITLAWAQAAASLTPALSQLAAANLQQHQQQLQKAYESQLQSYSQQPPPNQNPAPPAPQHIAPQAFSTAPSSMSFIVTPGPQQLAPVPFQSASSSMAPPPNVLPSAQQSQSFARQPTVSIAPQPLPIAAKPSITSSLLPRPSAPQKLIVKPATTEVLKGPGSPNRSKEDEAAGTMLMGFLTSLRQGFMEAKNSKGQEDRVKVTQGGLLKKAAALAALGENQETESGTTSYPADSSPEDSSQSDQGGKDPSSSEESDSLDKPRGPPRKRLKTKIGEFTSRNVAAHTTRMNAIHHAEQQHQSDAYAAGHSNGAKDSKSI